MDYWPSYIPKPSSLSESVDDPYIEATSETGDDAARVRYSKERQGPTKLTWKIMRLGDFVALKQFYADHRAIEFLWLHPSRGLTYKTRFVSSPISSSEDGKSPFVAQVEVTLQIVELAPTEQEQPSVSDLMDTINAGADKAVQAAIDAEQARDDAKDYAKKAAASAKEAADTAAEIPAAVEAGIERIEEAGAAQVEAVNSAGTTQVSKVNSAGTKQTTAVNSAGTAQVSKVNSAGTAQVKAVEDAGSEQIAAVKSEGKAQTAAAKKQADAAAASAEEAAERLAEFKDLGAAAKTLAAGSKATASFDSSTGILTIGVPEGKKGDKGDPGTFLKDGVTVIANASGEAVAKDLAIGGDASDLASDRGQIGNIPTTRIADLNTFLESGVYRVKWGDDNNPGLNTPPGTAVNGIVYVASCKNAVGKIMECRQIVYRLGTPGSNDWNIFTREMMSGGTWSPWRWILTDVSLGDGLYFTNGKVSVPNYEGATASTAGTSGLVPPAAAGQQESFLTGGGEYKPALTKISDSVNLADSKTAASTKSVKTVYDSLEALRLSFLGVPRYWRSTTLPENHVWANGDLVLFSDWPELKKVYDDGGFAGMLLAYNADSATIAANLGKWRPNAAKPTGLYVPKLDGQFFRACTGAGQAGETVTDKGRHISGTWVTGWNSAFIPTIGTGGAVYTISSQANEPVYSSNIKVSRPFNVGFDSALVWDEHDGDEFVPAHVHIPLILYMGRTA